MRRFLRSLWYGLSVRWRGVELALRAVDQLQAMSEQPTIWSSTGSDPKFACLSGAFPLKAGWYELSIELHDCEGDRLEPVLYFDYGHGMREDWSLHLNFVQPGARMHRGVIMLPHDVRELRLDPANTPCTFHARHFRLRRLSRIDASWRMWRVVTKNAAANGSPALHAEAWLRLREPGGRRAFAAWLHAQYVRRGAREATYERWCRLYDHHDGAPSQLDPPQISILMPVFNTPEVWLRQCLDSVLAQSWTHWELCAVDDASTEPQVRSVLEEYATRDARIHVIWRDRNGHISAASNDALAMARGAWVALLDHDDELHSAALATVAEGIARHPRWQILYTDEDKIDVDGRRYDPYFKPDWNRDLLLGQNCFSHLGVYSRKLVNDVGGFREGLEGSQDWDLALRCSERLQSDQIGHVPAVLYHWRAIVGSTAQGVDQKGYAHGAGQRAVREHLLRRGEAAEVLDIGGVQGAFRIRWPLPELQPRISIVIPTRDRMDLLRQCIDSILLNTTYANYEVVVVDNQSTEPTALAYLASFARHPRVRVLHHDRPFNYSAINNEAVDTCRGELICLLNNDIEVITPGWLEELAGQAMRSDVGAVGAMLYYPDNTIQHAGVITGVHGVAAHPYCGMPRGYAGQMGRARLTQVLSAVTAACLMVRRTVYQQVGGLDTELRVAFNDVDFCLRLRKHGYQNVWTPFAELYHHESASRGREDTEEKRARFSSEVNFMMQRWAVELQNDPAYNVNLTLTGEPFTLAFPPRDWRVSGGISVLEESAAAFEDPRSWRTSAL
jgi:glycosyltransferase involved in cell wall biosynthesis